MQGESNIRGSWRAGHIYSYGIMSDDKLHKCAFVSYIGMICARV